MSNKETTNTDTHTALEGVGVRHRDSISPQAGGMYLNNCNDYKTRPIGIEKNLPQADLFLALDGKRYLDEILTPMPGQRAKPVPEVLRNLHLAPVWQRVAAELGLQGFLELWQILDQYAPREGDRARIDLPNKQSLAKLQRNQVIKMCAAQGLKPAQIQTACKKLGYKDVSERTIYRETKL
jgi:hypothetical protein